MRLGGPLFEQCPDPESWVKSHQRAQYRAAFCPLPPDADDATVKAYADAAAAADLVIAEVGAWSNPLGPDEAASKAALEHCKRSLDLADRIGARCCVNIAGSRGEKWDGPCAEDLTEETFDLIVEMMRDIIDTVKPTRSYYTLETMPWMIPDSADSYVAVLNAVDRKAFAVHFDPVNLINSPQRYFNTKGVIDEFVAKLGPHIRSCHGKDIALRDRLTTHLDEVQPGLGGLDYGAFLQAVAALPEDTPIMLEHLTIEEEYVEAANYVRSVAKAEGLTL